jgi:hypothetical protein
MLNITKCGGKGVAMTGVSGRIYHVIFVQYQRILTMEKRLVIKFGKKFFNF